MNRKIIKAVSIGQFILCIVSYISMVIHFDADTQIFELLEKTDFVATALRLSLYIVPGIHLLSSLYGLVFDDRTALIIIGIIELINCCLTFTFVGSSTYMLMLSAVSTLLSLIYLANVIALKKNETK